MALKTGELGSVKRRTAEAAHTAKNGIVRWSTNQASTALLGLRSIDFAHSLVKMLAWLRSVSFFASALLRIVIDRSGKFIIPAQFQYARGFSQGLAEVELGESGDTSTSKAISPSLPDLGKAVHLRME